MAAWTPATSPLLIYSQLGTGSICSSDSILVAVIDLSLLIEPSQADIVLTPAPNPAAQLCCSIYVVRMPNYMHTCHVQQVRWNDGDI